MVYPRPTHLFTASDWLKKGGKRSDWLRGQKWRGRSSKKHVISRFRPGVAFSLSVLSLQIPGLSERQGGRKMSAPRPCVTDPFLTKLSSARFAQNPNKLLHVFESENSFLFHMAHTALTLVQNKQNAGMGIC